MLVLLANRILSDMKKPTIIKLEVAIFVVLLLVIADRLLWTNSPSSFVVKADAATGRLIAESDFFEPITIGSLVTPGFGGRVCTYRPARDSS
jgi:hypothetical protein